MEPSTAMCIDLNLLIRQKILSTERRCCEEGMKSRADNSEICFLGISRVTREVSMVQPKISF